MIFLSACEYCRVLVLVSSIHVTLGSSERIFRGSAGHVQSATGSLIGTVSVVGILLADLVQSCARESARYRIAGDTVRGQVNSFFRHLVRIFRCGDFRDEALVLAVEVDEHERCKYQDAGDAVTPEGGRCAEVRDKHAANDGTTASAQTVM